MQTNKLAGLRLLVMLATESQISVVPFERAGSPRVRAPDEVPNYELLGMIGSSRFGDVWLARERLTDVPRAIKFLDKQDGQLARIDLDGVRRYQQCSHNHPQLLQIMTVGETERCYYYVMEIADDEPPDDEGRVLPATLRARLARTGRWPARAAMEFVATLGNGVARLHEQGLKHNDIKPENILFVQGEPKLADVGLMTTGADSRGYGTPGYMTPQGHADDAYALGKVLYELTTGLAADGFPRLPHEMACDGSCYARSAIALFNQACRADERRRLGSVVEFQSAVQSSLDAARRRRRRRDVLLVTMAAVALISPGIWWFYAPVARIFERRAESVYTGLIVNRAKIPNKTPVPGESFDVHVDFDLAAAATHDVIVAITLDSMAECAQQVYLATPGQRGVERWASVQITAPRAPRAYDVRIYVSHVRTFQEFKESLTRHNPGQYKSLGTIRVR